VRSDVKEAASRIAPTRLDDACELLCSIEVVRLAGDFVRVEQCE
jgi:hypothetical protein